MEPDTIEKIQRDLDAINARVAAFEKAQKQAADVEPPTVTNHELETWSACFPDSRFYRAAVEIRYLRAEPSRLRAKNENCSAAHDAAWVEVKKLADVNHGLNTELARLREGLKVQESDINSLELESWGDDNDFEYRLETMRAYIRSQCRAMAREIQRHRKLLDGAK